MFEPPLGAEEAHIGLRLRTDEEDQPAVTGRDPEVADQPLVAEEED